MGGGRWDPQQWATHTTTTAHQPRAAIFKQSGIDEALDPSKISLRKSCDSAANPNSTPIILGIDQTGSMGKLAEELIKRSLGVLVEEIYTRRPVVDPHVMCMAIGDAWSDRSPLQVTQFEAENKPLIEQIAKLYLEGNGGGNGYESYHFPWWFAATRTKTDSFIKRNKKGYLFTMGDERPPPSLLASEVRKVFGNGPERDMTTAEVLALVSQTYEVFHLMIAEGHHFQGDGPRVTEEWRALLGERAILLSDHTKMAEVIVSILQINEGADSNTVADSWSGDTSLVVRNAVGGLAKRPTTAGVVRL